MEFRIADTFTDSLSKLTSQEQKVAKTTAFDLQINPESPGLRFHKLGKCKDPNFCSVSVNMDLRLIVHKTDNSLLLCYVDHHEPAYAWAERRKIATHPTTRAAQLVEVRETVEEVVVQKSVTRQPLLFDRVPEADLLSYGVPLEWVPDVFQATEDNLLDIAEHLPQEAAEALLALATGGKPPIALILEPSLDPFKHPDAQRRFRSMGSRTDLQIALDYPWEKWTVFLHPTQRDFVERPYSGSARISGSAGTGKTIVALHRAVHLARLHPQAQILITTFSPALANALKVKLSRLLGIPLPEQISNPDNPLLPQLGEFLTENDPPLAGRIKVYAIQDLARQIYAQSHGEPTLATDQQLRSFLINTLESSQFKPEFLWSEWKEVVDPWFLRTWEDYRDVKRLGRKTRLSANKREILWSIFQQVWQKLGEQGLTTESQLFHDAIASIQNNSPFDYAIADEAQDLDVPQLRFLAALGRQHKDGLFFTGDLGQRIFQQPFSWKSVGVSIQGRSHTLNINYRTSHQIRQKADILLPGYLSDVDGNQEDRRNTISLFTGPMPTIKVLEDAEEEQEMVARWLQQQLQGGVNPEEIGVFVRSTAELPRAARAVKAAGSTPSILDQRMMPEPDAISVSTMHLAKGLEFRSVAVMACDYEVIPLASRMEAIADESDLEEVYNTERHLLYVACTRARDELLITGVDPISEFVEDLL